MEEPSAKRTRHAKRRASADNLGLILSHVAANGLLAPSDLGRLSCVSKVVAERCREDETVAGVCRALWPGLCELPRRLVEGPGSWWWLLRQLSARLLASRRPNREAEAQEVKRCTPPVYDGGAQSVDEAPHDPPVSLDESILLVSLYDESSGRALISQAFYGGSDDLEEFLSTGVLKICLPKPAVLGEVVVKDGGRFGFSKDHGFLPAVDVICLKTRTSLGFVLAGGRKECDVDKMLDPIKHTLPYTLRLIENDEHLDDNRDWTAGVGRIGSHSWWNAMLTVRRDFFLRAKQCIPNFMQFYARFDILAHVPYTPPGVFSMKTALQGIREFNEAEGGWPNLGWAVGAKIYRFMDRGRSVPDAAPFFAQADEELAQLDSSPCATTNEVCLRLVYLTWDRSKKDFGACRSGIVREALESLPTRFC